MGNTGLLGKTASRKNETLGTRPFGIPPGSSLNL